LPAWSLRIRTDGNNPEFTRLQLVKGLLPAVWAGVLSHLQCPQGVRLSLLGRSRKRRSPRGLRHPLLEHYYLRTKAVRAATASERPSAGPDRARGNEPARIPQWHPGQYEILTNDEPRHQPARPETRPNQRLYVSLGSPPSVAVGSLSAPAAHRSRAPQIDKPRMTSIGTPVKVSRCEAAAVGRSIAEIGLFGPTLAPVRGIAATSSRRPA
jgi:hypothetical protein